MIACIRYHIYSSLCLICCLTIFHTGSAQTDADGIMMDKNNFCLGPSYSYSSWTHYWEGSLKRDNRNLGTVSMRTANLMGNYGISKKLNIIASLPYVRTKASAGTLGGQKGLQDFSLWLKWRALKIKTGRAVLSFYALGGLSFPVSDYTADFMPLSIGNESTNVSVRIMTDYLSGKFFITGSGTYVYRDNIKIDRSSYYTTHMHLTNEVEMPNAASFNLRTGYRSKWLILEAVVNNWTTLGGFDITRNNMPFPSNRMNATTLGAGFKYTFRALSTLSVIGGASTTVSGRNVGQSKGLYAGIFYNIRFSHRKESTIHSRSK